MDYIKFLLQPGQQAPAGSTSLALSDGYVVWIGDAASFPSEIIHETMTQDEIDEYQHMVNLPAIKEDALDVLKLSIFSEKGYQDIDDYMDFNVVDLASAKAAMKHLAKILLAICKYNDFT